MHNVSLCIMHTIFQFLDAVQVNCGTFQTNDVTLEFREHVFLH